MAITNQNLIQEEIKRRLNSGNACYHSVQNLLSSHLLSKNKLRIYKTIILPVVLYGCETWSLTLREEHRLRVFRRTFRPKKNEVTGGWRKLHNEVLHNLYSSASIIRMIKSRRMRWVGHVARRFSINPPCPKNIRWWFQQFQESGCLCKGKSPGRLRVSEEQVVRIHAAFERSPRKSTNRASHELAIPQSTVWRVLTVRLHLKPYRRQLVQALTNDDKRKRMKFCDSMLEMMEDETFISRLIFIEHERDSPKVNVFCAVSQDKVYGPFFFEGNTVTGQTYLDMLQNWLFTSLQADSHNEKVPQQWIHQKGAKDLALCAWPASSPDLTVCDFFSWGSVKITFMFHC
ncbi:hypothetical protein B7P43_G16927 [Cryptotermes secundus]|uniref:Transposase Tc1-like domain-containing protein n=1 Tax=Cryptotermes secundus TaxID=105785 RepID=A0A2J7RIX9_9NEOP|nr:hypothetical protein B7P43_G16927 [Cryptotermes secundus]